MRIDWRRLRMTSLHNLERRIAKLKTKPAGNEPLITELWKEKPDVFDEDGKLKQALFPTT